MATLIIGGSQWAEGVIQSKSESTFPCMDSNYRVLRWTFLFIKEFSTFAALLNFEQNTILGYFSNREYTVNYGGESENNCILQTYKRTKIETPGPPVLAEYEVVFSQGG